MSGPILHKIMHHPMAGKVMAGALEDRFGGAANPFASLFGAGDVGDVWLPVPGQSPMFTNDAETDAADTNADSVRSFQGMVNGLNLRAPADANRPTLNTDGTSWWLASNGVDQMMAVSYVQSDWPLLIAGVFEKGTASGEAFAAVYHGVTNQYKAVMNYTSDPFHRGFDANGIDALSTCNGPAGSTDPAYVRFNATANNLQIHVDGVDGLTTTRSPARAFGAATTHFVLFDRRDTPQAPSDSRCLGLMVRNRLFTDATEEAIFRDTVLSLQGLA